MINLFELDPSCRLADLPGYGYAKVSGSLRRDWQRVLEGYLMHRESLRGLVLLMDVRHPLTTLDDQMLRWRAARRLPVHVLLTKADKLGRGRAAATLREVTRRIAEGHGGVTAQLFSSLNGAGVEEARCRLDQWLDREPTSNGC